MRVDIGTGEMQDFVSGLITMEDVLNITKIIGASEDEYIKSRISYELLLSEESPDFRSTQIPLIMDVVQVIEEHSFHKNKIDSKKKEDIKCSIQLIRQQLEGDNLTKFNQSVKVLETEDIYHMFDPNDFDEGRYRVSGKTIFHRVFIARCAILYSELTRKKFTVEFSSLKTGQEPLTKGACFALEFHNILNRIALKNSYPTFSNSTFISSCENARKINGENFLSYATLFAGEY